LALDLKTSAKKVSRIFWMARNGKNTEITIFQAKNHIQHFAILVCQNV